MDGWFTTQGVPRLRRREYPQRMRAVTREPGFPPLAQSGPGSRGERSTMDSQSRGTGYTGAQRPILRPLWVDEPVGTPRLPEPVRNSAVRAGLIVAVTLIEAVVALLATVAGVWI